MKKNNYLDIFSAWKREIITSLVIVFCLVFFMLFPVSDAAQNFTRDIFFLVIVPILYVKFLLHKNLEDFGFNLRNKQAGLYWGGGMLLISLLLVFLLARFTGLKNNYHIPTYATANFWLFLVYELLFVNISFVMQEIFFKGFILFSFREKLGAWSIVISAGILLLLLTTTGNFVWQLAPIVILSITGSIVAYKSRSWAYSYFMGIIFLLLTDAYLISIIK